MLTFSSCKRRGLTQNIPEKYSGNTSCLIGAGEQEWCSPDLSDCMSRGWDFLLVQGTHLRNSMFLFSFGVGVFFLLHGQ